MHSNQIKKLGNVQQLPRQAGGRHHDGPPKQGFQCEVGGTQRGTHDQVKLSALKILN